MKTHTIYTRQSKNNRVLARTENGLYTASMKGADDTAEKLVAERLVNRTYGEGAEAQTTGKFEEFGRGASRALWEKWEVTRT